MYEEKVFTCIECERSVKKIVPEGAHIDDYLCPNCEMGDMDSDDDEED